MDKDARNTIIVVAVAVLIIAVGFIGISQASGVSPPQTVVESQSMQHGRESQIGIIDTGDVVLLKSRDKVNILSYVDGYKTGYKMFGSYGDVIIYDRGPNLNPVIHRAILWLDYNEADKTWSAPSLIGYPLELWYSNNMDPMKLSGVFRMFDMGYAGDKTAEIDLNNLARSYPHSGYLTMGDNNPNFDQPASISGVSGLIEYEKIRSVAWIEIPWVGTLKMALNGKMDIIDREVPNTVPCLSAMILLVIFLIIGISFLFDYRYYGKHRKELYKEMNAPTPSFPVEDD
ncbi:MAG: S26 family signal peptidase [Candidatus Methanoplasma sp.]|nr:S26 family signal peptidase [Candidatus Methanoplasma sp.]